MANSLRNDNHTIGFQTGVTTNTNSNNIEVGGSRGYSVLVKLTDNGSATGSVSLRAGLTENDFVIIPASTTAMSFTANEQKIIFNVTDPHYKFMDVAFVVNTGDLDYTASVTIIEGDM
jgi:hypothetical protein